MGVIARFGIYYAIYVASGLAVLVTHYYQTSAYSRETLDEQITLVAASHFSLSQLVDHLPSVFHDNEHAAALRLSDLKGDFLGAMYDSRRMTALQYKEFLGARITGKGPSPVPGFTLHTWESKRRRLRIYALSLPRAQFGEYLVRMGRDAFLHYAIPLYLLAGLLVLYGIYFFTGSRNTNQAGRSSSRSTRLPPSRHASPVNPGPAKPRQNAWHMKPGAIADSAIRDTLQSLRQMTQASSASLYARKKEGRRSQWEGVTELRGSIAIRGEAMDATGIFASDGASTYTVSPDGNTWYFFDAEFAEASLCFCLVFEANQPRPDSEMRTRIADFVRSRARALSVEHYYENSILDTETGLYSQPYAMFSLKERLLAGQPFAAAALRFADKLDARIARTAIRILREHYAADEAPVAASLNDLTLFVLFSPVASGQPRAIAACRQLCGALRSQGKGVAAAFIEDASASGGAQRFLRKMETLLATSEQSGELAMAESPQTPRLV